MNVSHELKNPIALIQGTKVCRNVSMTTPRVGNFTARLARMKPER